MNKVTDFASVALTLLLLAGLSAASALAQATTYYAEPNGTGTSPCAVDAPCSVTDAITASSTNDIISVRVRSEGGTTVIDGGLTLAASLVFAVHERSGSTATAVSYTHLTLPTILLV